LKNSKKVLDNLNRLWYYVDTGNNTPPKQKQKENDKMMNNEHWELMDYPTDEEIQEMEREYRERYGED
jgi:hypothetical protein